MTISILCHLDDIKDAQTDGQTVVDSEILLAAPDDAAITVNNVCCYSTSYIATLSKSRCCCTRQTNNYAYLKKYVQRRRHMERQTDGHMHFIWVSETPLEK